MAKSSFYYQNSQNARFAARKLLNTEQNVFRACNECISSEKTDLGLYIQDQVARLRMRLQESTILVSLKLNFQAPSLPCMVIIQFGAYSINNFCKNWGARESSLTCSSNYIDFLIFNVIISHLKKIVSVSKMSALNRLSKSFYQVGYLELVIVTV